MKVVVTTLVAALVCMSTIVHAAAAHRSHHLTVRSYARRLVLHRWHSLAEWRAEESIVYPESHWDACAVYPGVHDCFYSGSNSCGIPQRDPCPYAWRGHLFATRFAQVRALQRYIGGRYGDPLNALAFRETHHWY